MAGSIGNGVQMKRVRLSTLEDYPDWLKLAKEVEPLFGPMVEDTAFRSGLRNAIQEKTALCVSEPNGSGGWIFRGGIVVSNEANEILWLAVTTESRGQGMGRALLSEAMGRLAPDRPITVTTFDHTVEAGLPARGLYRFFGFRDSETTGVNPAGIPTVTMVRAASGAGP